MKISAYSIFFGIVSPVTFRNMSVLRNRWDLGGIFQEKGCCIAGTPVLTDTRATIVVGVVRITVPMTTPRPYFMKIMRQDNEAESALKNSIFIIERNRYIIVIGIRGPFLCPNPFNGGHES